MVFVTKNGLTHKKIGVTKHGKIEERTLSPVKKVPAAYDIRGCHQ